MSDTTHINGHLRKMRGELTNPVSYALVLDDHEMPLNQLIGQKLSFSYTGRIRCIACNRETKKSFQQGYCFPCTRKLAQCDSCIVKPELCHYHLGTCREPQWGEQHCMQPHIVYLANSSGLKIGITRQTQIPTRWIDQGAIQALPIAQVDSRLHSGLLEHAFKTVVADKTNWRLMLKGSPLKLDLSAERDRLFTALGAARGHTLSALATELATDITAIINHPVFQAEAMRLLPDAMPVELSYPIERYPEKVGSINLEKTPRWEAELWGIKGQYLITSIGVINLRKYAGYQVEVAF